MILNKSPNPCIDLNLTDMTRVVCDPKHFDIQVSGGLCVCNLDTFSLVFRHVCGKKLDETWSHKESPLLGLYHFYYSMIDDERSLLKNAKIESILHCIKLQKTCLIMGSSVATPAVFFIFSKSTFVALLSTNCIR